LGNTTGDGIAAAAAGAGAAAPSAPSLLAAAWCGWGWWRRAPLRMDTRRDPRPCASSPLAEGVEVPTHDAIYYCINMWVIYLSFFIAQILFLLFCCSTREISCLIY
jgi:hypothetical protein